MNINDELELAALEALGLLNEQELLHLQAAIASPLLLAAFIPLLLKTVACYFSALLLKMRAALHADPITRQLSAVLRAESGATDPKHRHANVEEIYMLEGDLSGR